MTDRPVMIAAGGTGGHLFPALALAEELVRRGIAVELVTDKRADQYDADSPARAVHQVPSATFSGRSPLVILSALFTLARGTLKAWVLLGRVRPSVLIAFGGYPTLPPLAAALVRGIPTAVHEQNAVMGRANRLMARFVTAIAASVRDMKYLRPADAGKVHLTGNPVRAAVVEASKMAYDPLKKDSLLKLLIFGGSQGARVFSDLLPPAIEKMSGEARKRLRIVQQCREEDLARVSEAYDRLGVKAKIAPFFRDLADRMAAAHLVVSRSGATTVAELTAIGRPGILVPLPHAIDNDQLANAKRLDAAGGAWLIEQKDLTPERLAREVEALMNDPARLQQTAKVARTYGRTDAVAALADLVEELAGYGRRA